MRKFILPLFLLALWFAVSELKIVNSFLLPSPETVFTAFIQLSDNGVLSANILTSMARLIAGFAIAFVLAVSLSVLFYLFPLLHASAESTIHFVQNIPPLAMLSLIIMWFGIGEESKIAIIVLSGFFPLFINIFNGLYTCDKKLIEVGSVIGMKKNDIFAKILIPNSIPYILFGVKIGISYSWRALTGAELIAASTGLGAMVLEARELSRSDIVIVGIFCFGIIGILIDKAFDIIANPYNKEKLDEY